MACLFVSLFPQAPVSQFILAGQTYSWTERNCRLRSSFLSVAYRNYKNSSRTTKAGVSAVRTTDKTGTLDPFLILSTPQPRKSQILDTTLINILPLLQFTFGSLISYFSTEKEHGTNTYYQINEMWEPSDLSAAFSLPAKKILQLLKSRALTYFPLTLHKRRFLW